MSVFNKISAMASDAADAARDAGAKIVDFSQYSAEQISELKCSAVKAVSEKADEFAKYFSESGFSEKLAKFGKKIGSAVAYPAILLYTALMSGFTSLKYKSVIAGCLGYFILPADIIPDIIPGIGFSDDAAAIMACLAAVKHILAPEVYQDADWKMKQIFGEVNTEELRKMTDTAANLIEDKTSNSKK